MRAIIKIVGLLGFLNAVSARVHPTEEFLDEELTLTPLSDGKLLAHFEFTTNVQAHTDPNAPFLDYGLFPKAIGQVLQEYDVQEMHLTFTQGRWNYEEWGYPPEQSAGTGVELWAWMKNSNKIDANWRSLTNVLSGLFCASLNFIDDTLTTQPRMSFLPEPLSQSDRENSQLRYGALPHENVCTENLTPWIKMLPCKAKSGIAVLLNAHKIYNSNFHAMGIVARSMCRDEACSERVLELRQTVTSVLDPVRDTGRRDWSLETIFERTLKGSCPLARQSRVLVNMDGVNKERELKPSPTLIRDEHTSENTQIAVYDLHQSTQPLDVRMSWSEPVFKYPLEPIHPVVSAQRYFTGYGQERGGLRITIHNRSPDKSIPVVYYESAPWFLKFFLHTLKVDVLGSTENDDDIIEKMYYQPAIDRARPTMLECRLNLPPQSVVTLSVDFEKVFLKYTEHRPDANRGFDVGNDNDSDYSSTSANTSASNSMSSSSMRIYTDTLLVSLPTPDFSMPYNVITLTCTVIALFFGSLFNLLIRSFYMVDSEDNKPKKS
ncbi:GPI transamidase GPI16 [Phycomyces blakesleeanus]|uniref:GPI transamidase GPI16 n=1 Tax=Phycomyces blakesleeanus TaxID=4837 RepID=A0ABR3AP56_PHYBL